MFEPNDEITLVNALSKGDAVLFLGAGFSALSKNTLGRNLPVGSQLAQLIWEFMGYTGTCDTNLPILYEHLIKSGKKKVDIQMFLEENLIPKDIPVEYNIISKPFWYRIYTTNIDNLVEESFKLGAKTKLKSLSYPKNEPEDKDQFLETTHIVHLNGLLPCDPNDVIFSINQYAQSTLRHQPLYELFIREYVTHNTIFIGASLEEPLFWEYLASRNDRSPGIKEYRPKSFAIASKISKVKVDYLKEHFNIICIEASTADFLEWLKDKVPSLPDKVEVLKSTIPSIKDFIQLQGYKEYKRELNSFAECFVKVAASKNISSYRSLFLMGTTPNWEDIYKNLDAPRTITKKIFDSVNGKLKGKEVDIIAITGTAGSGKSTILKRLGLILVQASVQVYYSDCEELPSPAQLFTVIKLFNERCVLLFDNSETILNVLPSYIREFEKLDNPPVIILCSRSYEFKRLTSKYKAIVDLEENPVPIRLDTNEINDVLQVLENAHLLGALKGLNNRERVAEFEKRSSKQLLIAMKEVTTGKGFDQIMDSEFCDITPDEAKILTLCVALATDAGHYVTLDEFIGMTDGLPNVALDILKNKIQDIVIERFGKLYLRHRAIAAYLIDEHVKRELLKEAYIRILRSLSINIKGRHWRDSKSGLYRSLINHRTIYKRFNANIDAARAIYDSLSGFLSDDFHFWLQYANLELEGNGGSLEFSENYLDQAESLSDSYYVLTTRGHLLLKKAVSAANKTAAIKFREEGEEILLNLIQTKGHEDPYFYHIYCYQLYNWIRNWTLYDDEEKGRELNELKSICDAAVANHPKNRILEEMNNSITRALYNMGIDRSNRPPDPILTFE